MTTKRITFSEDSARHLYELACPHLQDKCFVCKKVKMSLEKFLGDKEVMRIKRSLVKNPYCKKMKPPLTPSNSTEQVGSLKKKATCKGGRPHQPVLVLPPYGSKTALDLTQEQIERYYQIQDEREVFERSCNERLRDELGIPFSERMFPRPRYFVCANCGKKSNE